MPLKTYREKRNFATTPEPPPTEKRSHTGRMFCVQKHLATQLHYDFRLEHNGVLLSWAVPKGPSLDPATKRLAMHVEDHPVDYGSFEGVIPEGYGAGIVMLWDTGTWEPETDDIDAALKKGDLKFRLNGYKLKGSWVLVRTRGYQSNSWLLIKHRDEWAGDLDIAEFAPNSVKSAGDFADILASEKPEFWMSHRPGKGEAPAMLRTIVEKALALRAERETKSAGEKKTQRSRRSQRTQKPRSKKKTK